MFCEDSVHTIKVSNKQLFMSVYERNQRGHADNNNPFYYRGVTNRQQQYHVFMKVFPKFQSILLTFGKLSGLYVRCSRYSFATCYLQFSSHPSNLFTFLTKIFSSDSGLPKQRLNLWLKCFSQYLYKTKCVGTFA